jgi:eukaryotic-like serine/threonine-protein kinase
MGQQDSINIAGNASSARLKIPRTLGRITLMNLLGRGGMGVVLKGWDPFIERFVAVKIPLPSKSEAARFSGMFSKEFFREAQTAGKLSHPNIVSIYDADIQNDFCYLTMEYIDGTTLKTFCPPERSLNVDKIVNVISNTCRGLDYAHNQGVVHWDVKPENIMLNSAGGVKITDFSIAKMRSEALKEMVSDRGYDVSGSITYMSPQHFSGQGKADSRCDVFSLGSVLYELLTGTPPFQGDNPYATMYKIANEDPCPITQLKPNVPEILNEITKKALCKDPDERYQSCMDFAYDLAVASRHFKRSSSRNAASAVADYIKNISFFENFSTKQFRHILTASRFLKIPKRKIVVAEGEVDDTLFIILSGRVEVLKGDLRIDTISRGECFGEMAYLSGAPRAATIKTITDCILIKISAALVDRLPESIQILFLKSFAKITVGRIGKNHQFILNMLNKSD